MILAVTPPWMSRLASAFWWPVQRKREDVTHDPVSPKATRRLVTAAVLFLGLLAAPGAFDAALGGAPLTLAGRGILVGVVALLGWTTFLAPRRVPPRRALAAMALLGCLKVAAGCFSTPSGWRGEYRTVDTTPAATGQFFARFGSRPYRLDPVIDFEGPGLGLHFLNTWRYARRKYTPVRRDISTPLEIQWTGYVQLRDAASPRLLASARGQVEIRAGGRIVFMGTDPVDEVADLGEFGRGATLVVVHYLKPAGVDPLISVSWEGLRGPVRVTPEPVPPGTSDVWLSRLTTGAVGVGVILLCLVFAHAYNGAWPRTLRARGNANVVMALMAWGVFLLLCAGSFYVSAPQLGLMGHLTSGNDPLIYESGARDIMQHGLLMPGGRATGQGQPYYHYPLYSYFLAGVHWVIGEDYAAVTLANGLTASVVVPVLWALGWIRLRWWSAVAGLVALGLVCVRHILPYTREAFPDNLFLPLALGVVLVTSRALRDGSRGWAMLAGLVSAAAGATRPSLLTFPPLLAVGIMLRRRDWSALRRATVVGCMLLGFGVGLAPFAARNYIMSSRFVVLVNSWVQVPYFLVPPGEPLPPWLVWTPPPTLSESVAWAVRIARAEPMRTLAVEARKGGFTMGWTSLGPQGTPLHPEFVAVTLLGLTAFVLGRVPPAVRLASAAFAISHLAALVLAAPWTYGYKTILPIQLVFLHWGAFLLDGRTGPQIEAGARLQKRGGTQFPQQR